MNLSLSIIIVNYNNQDLILQCVKSIVENEKLLNYELIVIDNNSKINSERALREIYPKLRWIQMGYNSGFGRANNTGIKVAQGEFIILLNSDVIVKNSNTLYNCLNYLKGLPEYKETVMGTRLVNPDNTYQETLRLNFPGLRREIAANSLFIIVFQRLLKRKRKEKTLQYNAHFKSGNVAWINGAFLLIFRERIVEHNLFFDPDFFLYGEDVEWAWRANKAKMNFHHFHKTELTHIGSASMPNDYLKRCQIIVSDWIFIKKARGYIYLVILLGLVKLNLFSDEILYQFAKLRRRRFVKTEIQEYAFRKIYRYLLKKYGSLILRERNISSETKFYTNCYEDEVLAKKIEQIFT